MLGRHPDRIASAKEFGATNIVRERDEEAVERVRELTPRGLRPRARKAAPRTRAGESCAGAPGDSVAHTTAMAGAFAVVDGRLPRA